MLVWIAVGVVALLVLVALGLTWFAVSTASARNAPERVVDAYLSAVVDGHVEDAVAMAGGAPKGALPDLLTDEAYAAATDRVTGYTISSAGIDDSGATVVATIQQGGDEYSQAFRLSRDGKEALFVDRWALDPIDFGYLTVAFDGPAGDNVSVDGTPIDASVNDILSRPLPAFPGTYVVSSSSADGKLQFADDSVTVAGFSADADGGEADSVIAATLTADGEAAGQAAAAGWLDACVAQPVLAPLGCDFYGETNDGETVTDIVWTIESRPTFTIGAWTADGWEVIPASGGKIYADGNYSLPSGEYGTVRYTLSNYAYGGYLNIVDGVMTFTFEGSNSGSGGGINS